MKTFALITLSTLSAAVSGVALPADNAEQQILATTYHGKGTYYDQMGGYGSCGHKNPDSSKIVALSNTWMNHKANAPLCGHKVHIRNTQKGSPGYGNTAVAVVADTCPGCDQTHLDMSRGLFGALTNNDFGEGTFSIDWYFE